MKKPTAKKSHSRFRHISNPQIFTKEEIDLSNAKINIHIRLDADIVRYFKEKAAREGGNTRPCSTNTCVGPSGQSTSQNTNWSSAFGLLKNDSACHPRLSRGRPC